MEALPSHTSGALAATFWTPAGHEILSLAYPFLKGNPLAPVSRAWSQDGMYYGFYPQGCQWSVNILTVSKKKLRVEMAVIKSVKTKSFSHQ